MFSAITVITELPSIKMGLDPNHQMTEREIHDYYIPEGVGVHWRDLARALKFLEQVIKTIKEENGNNPKECCTDLLVRWMGREGRDATAGILADSLRSIGLKNVADRLICPSKDPIKVNGCGGDVRIKFNAASWVALIRQ